MKQRCKLASVAVVWKHQVPVQQGRAGFAEHGHWSSVLVASSNSHRLEKSCLALHSTEISSGASAGPSEVDRTALQEGIAAPPPGGKQGVTKWAGSFGGVAFPPLPDQLGSRVEHLLAYSPGLLTDIVARQLDMPLWFVKELLRFGAIYWCPVMPTLTPEVAQRMSAEGLRRAETARLAAMSVAGRDPANSVPRRPTVDVKVVQHAFIRVHCHPKRFPAAHACNWQERIVYNGADYVVVNKPAGVPTAPTVDNLLESCPACTATAVGHNAPLLITSRLDHCTEGLVILAKTPPFAALYNHLQISRTDTGAACVRKWYRALSHRPPRKGTMVHYLRIKQRCQGKPTYTAVHGDDSRGGQHSELEILEVSEVALAGQAAGLWGSHAYESFIELKTGRTHQIRAQLAAVGAAICGDTLYQTSPPEGSEAVQALPKGAIGLQCTELKACNLHKVTDWRSANTGDLAWSNFVAGDPWWRA